jgi:hypothetical protein
MMMSVHKFIGQRDCLLDVLSPDQPTINQPNHTYIHTCIHTCLHAHIHTYNQTHRHTQTHTPTYIHAEEPIHIYIRTYGTHAYIHTYHRWMMISKPVRMYVCMHRHACMYVYLAFHAKRQRQRQRLIHLLVTRPLSSHQTNHHHHLIDWLFHSLIWSKEVYVSPPPSPAAPPRCQQQQEEEEEEEES